LIDLVPDGGKGLLGKAVYCRECGGRGYTRKSQSVWQTCPSCYAGSCWVTRPRPHFEQAATEQSLAYVYGHETRADADSKRAHHGGSAAHREQHCEAADFSSGASCRRMRTTYYPLPAVFFRSQPTAHLGAKSECAGPHRPAFHELERLQT